MSSATESFDVQTSRLIDAAHHCATLPAIEECLPYRNFGEMWESLSGKHGDRQWMTYYPCASDDETPSSYTFADFAELIEQVATLLSKLYGIEAGGAVATLTINHPLTVAIYFAAWRLGARVVPINPSEADNRVGYIVENSGATLIVAHRTCREDYSAVESVLPSSLKRAVILETGQTPISGWDDFCAMLEVVEPNHAAIPPRPLTWDNEALVVYTSGTTGNPKGVVLTQKQMFADAYAISQWHAINQHTILMNVLPIHHVNGIIVTLVTPAFVGAHVVVNRRFKSGGFWKKLARENVAIISVVPTLLQFLFESNEEFMPEDLPNFRHFICGAGPLSVELARDFQDRFGLKIMHGYGLSETVCYSCFLPTELEWDDH